jgi:AcrR family transcriptional regulator
MTTGRSSGSSRRGAETRVRIERAAAELIVARGYIATTMEEIAAAAGVHVQTIYLAYGTKAALLAATAARLVAGEEDPETHPSQRRWARQIQAARDPRRKIELYVEYIVDVTPRIAALIDVLRATAPAEPEVAAFLAQMERGRREGPLNLLGPLAEGGELRTGLDSEAVADTVFAIVSPDTVRALITNCDWEAERAKLLLTEVLCRELFA